MQGDQLQQHGEIHQFYVVLPLVEGDQYAEDSIYEEPIIQSTSKTNVTYRILGMSIQLIM